MATLDELQQQLAALSARVDALTTPPDDYYTSKYSGEEIDAGIAKTGSLPESWPFPVSSGGTGADTPQLALANLGGGPNRNLLDNWCFAGGGSQKRYGVFPVNQRGQVSYSTAQQTMFDRWWHGVEPGTFELTDEGLKITAEAGANASMAQIFDTIIAEATTVTLSALYRGQVILDFYGYTDTSSPVVNDGWGMHFYTYTIPAGTNLANKIYCPTVKAVAGTTAYILAVKFEIGDKQTLAYQDSMGQWCLFETTDYGAELARCGRYLRAFNAWTKCTADYIDSNRIMFSIPGDMRADPVVSGFNLYTGVQLQSGFTFEAHRNGNNITVVASKTGHGLTSAWLGVADKAYLSAEL